MIQAVGSSVHATPRALLARRRSASCPSRGFDAGQRLQPRQQQPQLAEVGDPRLQLHAHLAVATTHLLGMQAGHMQAELGDQRVDVLQQPLAVDALDADPDLLAATLRTPFDRCLLYTSRCV